MKLCDDCIKLEHCTKSRVTKIMNQMLISAYWLACERCKTLNLEANCSQYVETPLKSTRGTVMFRIIAPPYATWRLGLFFGF